MERPGWERQRQEARFKTIRYTVRGEERDDHALSPPSLLHSAQLTSHTSSHTLIVSSGLHMNKACLPPHPARHSLS